MTGKIYDVIIVGAGIAGMTAAIYARRAGKSVLVIESKVCGGQIVSAMGVRNWPGEDSISGAELSQKIYHQMNNLDVEIIYDEVEEIREEDDDGCKVKIVKTIDGVYQGWTVILAIGSLDRELGIPRETELIGHGISYCVTCDGALFKGKDVAVVGGGNTAFYDVLYLADMARKIYLVHRREEFRADEVLVEKVKALEQVEMVLSSVPVEILGEEKVEGLVVEKTENVANAEAGGADNLGVEKADNLAVKDKMTSGRILPVEGVFVAIGRKPDTARFKNLVRLDRDGYIEADESCRTSCPGVFAAGDCRTKAVRQLVTAASDGAAAATAAVDFLNS